MLWYGMIWYGMVLQVTPATRHLGFDQTSISFKNAKPQQKPPQHKATAWSNRRDKVQRTIGNYFPPTSSALQPAAPTAASSQLAAPVAFGSVFFSGLQAPPPVSQEHFDEMDTS